MEVCPMALYTMSLNGELASGVQLVSLINAGMRSKKQ